MLTLIRIAAGCGETLAAAAAATGREPDFILASAELYLRQVVCFPGADPHRVLAVPPHAPRDEMRRHLRELLLWLHPDRSRSEWNAVATRRVIAAWQAVGDAAAAQPPRRMRPVPAFRPSWIARPLTRARPIRAPRHRLWGLLRLALLVAGMVVPAFVPFGLTAGLTRLPDASHGVRAGGDVATLAGCGGPVS
ncbi:hypothetical protein SAMN02799631_00793 [Methylobacterium sp. 174MFSha1.1]|nr:hypothetical protein SAMN02799631_00793 [Methylobacterium sp. 174MFSha1.1]